MVADLPENYAPDGKLHPAFAFIDAVPTDWQQSMVLDGKIGQYLVMARQGKHSNRWFVGATGNEHARPLSSCRVKTAGLSKPLVVLSVPQALTLSLWQCQSMLLSTTLQRQLNQL